jgi:two-component system phosphate regulon response regulator PhoB
MARIVVIEEEEDGREVLARALGEAGHSVRLASTGHEGIDVTRRRRPDLVIVGVSLPDVSGLEVCRALRADGITRDVRIVLLGTSRDQAERAGSREVGADASFVKPFAVRELLARIEVLVRGAVREKKQEAPAEIGPLRVDASAERVWVEGQEIDLTAIEMKLLLVLLARRGRVQSREALLHDVWGLREETETRTLDTHVKRLRQKLGAGGACVRTVRGVGYVLDTDARE